MSFDWGIWKQMQEMDSEDEFIDDSERRVFLEYLKDPFTSVGEVSWTIFSYKFDIFLTILSLTISNSSLVILSFFKKFATSSMEMLSAKSTSSNNPVFL